MTKKPLEVLVIWLAVTTNSLAAEISEPLYCAVQKFTSISVVTSSTDPISVEKTDPGKRIDVIYKPLPGGKQVVETYGVGSDVEKTSVFNKGYSAGGTQYLSQDSPDQAITYFGLNDDGYYVVVKYVRINRNEGGEKLGWRTDSYFNVFMYCANSRKAQPTRK